MTAAPCILYILYKEWISYYISDLRRGKLARAALPITIYHVLLKRSFASLIGDLKIVLNEDVTESLKKYLGKKILIIQ